MENNQDKNNNGYDTAEFNDNLKNNSIINTISQTTSQINQQNPQNTEVPTSEVPSTNPTALEPKNNKSKRKIVLLALLLVTIATIVVFVVIGFLYYRHINSPEYIFKKAVEKRLSVKYIEQNYDISNKTSDYEITTKVNSQSDFSNPSLPKTTGSSIIQRKELIGSASAVTINIENDFICIEQGSCYYKVNAYDIRDISLTTPQINNIKTGAWKNIKLSSDDISMYDPLGASEGINSVAGEFITGTINGETKSKILKHLKDGDLYTIKSTHKENYQNHAAIKYSIEFNNDNLTDVNDTLVKQYKIKNILSTENNIGSEYDIWIDTKTKEIFAIKLSAKMGETDYSNSIKIKELDSLEIKEPKNSN